MRRPRVGRLVTVNNRNSARILKSNVETLGSVVILHGVENVKVEAKR